MLLLVTILVALIFFSERICKTCNHKRTVLYGDKARTKNTPFVCLDCGKIISREEKLQMNYLQEKVNDLINN